MAVVAGAAFAFWERQRTDPFIDVRVFAGNVPLLMTYARAFLASVVSYSFIYGFTQWIEQGRGLSPALAGLILLPETSSRPDWFSRPRTTATPSAVQPSPVDVREHVVRSLPRQPVPEPVAGELAIV